MSHRFMSDSEVAERVLGHMRSKTTDLGDEVWREPVANYRSVERLEREIEVLRRCPTPFCPSAALPAPGSYVARDAAGTPLVAVRGEDGRVRAFRNACRHRGTPLASGSGCAKAFVCRYHGWTYRNDGRLIHVPHEHGFPGLEKERHGLVPVETEEKHGLIFVTQDGPALFREAGEGLGGMLSSDQELLDCNEAEVEANWKVFLEGFIEGYHIRTTHPESFYPFGFDNLNVVETCGRNSRVTYPFQRIAKLKDVPPDERRLDGLVTYVVHLFPNTLVTKLSHHTSFVVLEPISLDRTRVITYTLTNRNGSAQAREDAKRDAAFVTQTGVAEDREIVSAIQRSISSGANDAFTFGRFEGAIVHFHRTLTRALAEAPGGP